ncbi:ATP-dependent helicase HrpB [Terrihabitans rhizophilus]|uniref:ATP-dependent helicase HrpB n=1 Tax=Terrihabitans rhizophilus TaxID=3092662 RepID=A0ABU4RI63_9HYPH|nr:ATP-dependent helicase HrpB [Terrihabitans sp. PJ23]MDX6804518.1 ATP-dependent helicase HrpB [Terrihabitans sp. PJ23]
MSRFNHALPIDDALPRLRTVLEEGTRAVLVASPGAGKTTRVPLDLLDASWRGDGRILVLEPRRIAARAAAERMASSLGQQVGGVVGLRVRLGSKIGPATRIEVVTEGVFTRMVLDDPELGGIAAVLFDEFHERSLDADLGLALALDAQAGLREDLRILVMSATLDGARVARLLDDAPVVESLGRAFTVETRYRGRDPVLRLEEDVAAVARRALREEEGSVLVFLPGQAEIRRTGARLRDAVPPDVDVVELHGGLDPREQDKAVQPAAPGRRKVVLATSIAETSLTIEGVRIVVDCGLARVPAFEPSTGLTRLETVRVSRAAADQRRGRAGRTEPGVCYRMWEEAAASGFPAFGTPEILSADLTGLVLDLAVWGVADPGSLRWLDAPPAPAWTEAVKLLCQLGALDATGRITPRGRDMRRLPLPPRLAAMILDAARRGMAGRACDIALLLVERGLGGEGADIGHRLAALQRDSSRRAAEGRSLAAGWRREADRVCPPQSQAQALSDGAILSLAYPDRVAQARGKTGEFRLASGRGALIDPAEALARAPFLTVADLSGAASSARIRLAAEIGEDEILTMFADIISAQDEVSFDRASASVRARSVRRLGSLVLSDTPRAAPRNEQTAERLATGIAAIGLERLPWTRHLLQLRDRVGFLRRAHGDGWPDLSDGALAASVADWLAPQLVGKAALSEISAQDLDAALGTLIPYELARRLDAEAPTHIDVPSGSRLAIDYSGEEPLLSVRVQELFGLDRHPAIAGGRIPVVLELLSPAQRPVQVTRDLPGFWRGSWTAVRSDMRGRYPRHPWPEDPRLAEATRRAKPRGT